MLSAFMCTHFGYFNRAERLCCDLESLLLFPQILVYKADTQVRDHKDEWRSTSVLNQSVTLPTECFLHPVETDNTHPAMAPVCVWYMKAFVTLGGVLSVCFTVTLHERCSERVAIGASLLLSSAPPLHLLRLCRISLLFFPFFSLPYIHHSSVFPSFYESPFLFLSPSLAFLHSTLHLSLWPSVCLSLAIFFPPLPLSIFFTSHTQTATLNLPVGVLASAVQSGSLVGDWDKSWRVTTGVEREGMSECEGRR